MNNNSPFLKRQSQFQRPPPVIPTFSFQVGRGGETRTSGRVSKLRRQQKQQQQQQQETQLRKRRNRVHGIEGSATDCDIEDGVTDKIAFLCRVKKSITIQKHLE